MTGISVFAKTLRTNTVPEEQDAAERKADCFGATSQIHNSMLPFELPSQMQEGDRERLARRREKREASEQLTGEHSGRRMFRAGMLRTYPRAQVCWP